MNLSAQIALMKNPVDPVLFLEMTQVFQDAARKPLPKPKRGAPGWYLADIPLNRGMLAVCGALKAAKVSEDEVPAIMNRILLMGSVFDNAALFPTFIKQSSDDPEAPVDVADVLLKALAVARIADVEPPSFDLADVLVKAQKFEDDATGKASSLGSKAQ